MSDFEPTTKKICIHCKDFKDAGPVSAHLAGIEGECMVDGHLISGSLQECDVNNHSEINRKLNHEDVLPIPKEADPDDVVSTLTDLEILETIYYCLRTPIERRRHSDDFNECVKRLGSYIFGLKALKK